MDKIIVTITGFGLIAAIYWFFFGVKDEAELVEQNVAITVDGGYKPKTIKVKAGQTITLTLIRKDSNPCLEEIVLPDFKIKEYLPLNSPVSVTFTPPRPGTYDIHCGMNMFHGSILAV